MAAATDAPVVESVNLAEAVAMISEAADDPASPEASQGEGPAGRAHAAEEAPVAQEERDTGVRSNAIAPTAIRTASNLESMGPNARYVEREEVAEVVEFLCFSEASRSITGQVVQLG